VLAALRAGATVAIVSFLACAAVADADQIARYHGHVDGTAVQPEAASQIELTRVFAVADPLQAGALDTQTVECAFFVNHGPKGVRHVRVRWTYTASGGGDAGTVVGSDTKDVWGDFGVNVPIEIWPQNGNALGKQCQTVKADIADGSLRLWAGKRAASLSASVEAVDFSDGSGWRAAAGPGT